MAFFVKVKILSHRDFLIVLRGNSRSVVTDFWSCDVNGLRRVVNPGFSKCDVTSSMYSAPSILPICIVHPCRLTESFYLSFFFLKPYLKFYKIHPVRNTLLY